MRLSLPFFAVFSFCMIVINNMATAQCDANFTYTANGSQVSFTSTSTGTQLNHSWYFGDGTPQAWQANPVHTYYLPGQYTVTLIVRDTVNNCIDSASQVISLNFSPTCHVNFTYTRPSLFSGLYNFYTQINIPGTTLQNISWTINGSPAFTQGTSSYTFTQAGAYAICVTIQTASGCTSQKCDTINYIPYNGCNLSASFTATPDPVQTRKINFAAQPVLAGAKYTWQFGDGQTGYGPTTSHTYAYAGNYTVGLLIADTINHCFDSLLQVIQVTAPPGETCTAALSWTASGVSPNQVSLTASSNQTITSYYWTMASYYDSSNLLTSTLAAPVFTVPDSGYYMTCVQITTNTGCITQACDSMLLSRTSGRGESNQVLAFPNPASGDEISFRFDVDPSAPLLIRIYSSEGVLVKSVQGNRNAGTGIVTIPIQDLRGGQYYFVEIQNGNSNKRSKFLKLRS